MEDTCRLILGRKYWGVISYKVGKFTDLTGNLEDFSAFR